MFLWGRYYRYMRRHVCMYVVSFPWHDNPPLAHCSFMPVCLCCVVYQIPGDKQLDVAGERVEHARRPCLRHPRLRRAVFDRGQKAGKRLKKESGERVCVCLLLE